ncbi:MAG: hypothetical protein M1832_006191 [Thelocarpon impressellum]|nr:MAG: hypothetical protein M1832_006191 [Thelocarpon impressellum]
MKSRLFSSLQSLLQHENPLGLPRKGAPPALPRMQRGLPKRRSIPDVRKVLAVSSAKGGVGKSTIADNQLVPLSNYGVKSMSMGYLVGESAPVVWRGLMVMKALQQLLHEVDWGGLDVLVLDLPPGTGDTQLTITQQINLDGAVIVSTPQDIALKDAVKGINMFKKVDVPILGMVQNMSVFTCPHCAESTHIFGAEGVVRECAKHDVAFLGDIPLHASICSDADKGVPTVVAEPGSTHAEAFVGIAKQLEGPLGLA